MCRIRFAAVLLCVVACSDQTGVTVPSQPPTDFTPNDNPESTDLDFNVRAINDAHTPLSGGATTVFDFSVEAFSSPAPNLQGQDLARHAVGDGQFDVVFVPPPAAANAGLGPVFDNVACESCHEHDGRGRPPIGAEPFNSELIRASVAGAGPHGGPLGVPGFGTQLQLRAVPGILPEAQASVTFVDSTGRFADGTQFQLRVPTFRLTGVYKPLPGGTLISPRVAPFVFGLGLLEAVPEQDIAEMAYQNSRNRGRSPVSGRPNYVYDEVRHRTVLGRFGWKANTPNLFQQTAAAYNGDMGVTSSLFPAEACEGEYPQCRPHRPEVADQTVGDVTFYVRTLGVPARRSLDDPKAKQGEHLFYVVGCNGCHVSTLRTGVLPGVPEVSNQVIHPYTDLLLHDMGAGLADGRPDFKASGREWRTPPLWGIGLVQTVNDHTNFLHDGRARSLLEAVLWHGGEAETARERVKRLSAQERDALVTFLQSL